MERAEFSVAVPGGHLVGWVAGSGLPVLLLHGGPGLSNYLDTLATEIVPGYQVATYQQRGLAPSTTDGPFEVAQEVADVVSVLDHLGWHDAVLVGHSWGGHLVFHVGVAAPDSVSAMLAVDPLGAVGDGGLALFEAALQARTPEADWQRAHELDERAMRGEGQPGEAVESLRLLWPAYFPDRDGAPPMPDMRMSLKAYSGVFASMLASLPTLEASLPTISVPVGVVAGAQSPIPPEQAAVATARVIPGAWVEVVEGAGHFPWLDRPGSVRAALDRLAAQVTTS